MAETAERREAKRLHKQAERSRKRQGGLVRIDAWVPKGREEEARALLLKMREGAGDEPLDSRPGLPENGDLTTIQER